jgi:hypothetical protein
MTANKRNDFQTTSIATTSVKSAVHPVPEMFALAYCLIAKTANEAPEGFLRDTILISHVTQRLLLLKNTMQHSRPC